jgi:hypothetical protein
MANLNIAEAALGFSGASFVLSGSKAVYDIHKDVAASYKKYMDQDLDSMTGYAHTAQDMERVVNPHRPQPIASGTTTIDTHTAYSAPGFAGWENYRALSKAEVEQYDGYGHNVQYEEQWQDYDTASAPNTHYPQIGSKGQPLKFAASNTYHDQWAANNWQGHTKAKSPKKADSRSRHKSRTHRPRDPKPDENPSWETEESEDITSMIGAVRAERY